MARKRGFVGAWMFWRNWTVFGILVAGVMLALTALFSGGSSPAPQIAVQAETNDDKTSPAAAQEIELDEKEPEKSVFETIEGGFGEVVGAMATVLFYPVGATEQEFVELNHVEHYVRPRGSNSNEAFVKYDPYRKPDPDGKDAAESISELQAEILVAQDKLEISKEPREDSDNLAAKPYIRKGKIANDKIEFITVILDTSSKYVFVKSEGVYKKQLRPRKQLSDKPSDQLSDAEVQRRGELGQLKVDEDRAKAGDRQAYLLKEKTGGAPIVVLWLAFGAVFFTIFMRGINIWGFRHALQIVRGKYDNPKEAGEVTHFQALCSALSATVGLGNIAGVTIAMTMGGPGAFFWMLCCGFFGMTSKFVECTLGQKYRRVKPDGTVLGGPMQYLYEGLKELKMAPVGLVLSIIFAIMCILASFGGGNMFQANQAGQQVLTTVQKSDYKQLEKLNGEIKGAAAANDYKKLVGLQKQKKELEGEMEQFSDIFKPVFGLVLALLVGVVIIGGIKRIGKAAEKIVPSMCLIYVATCLYIIFAHITDVPALVGEIFTQAWNAKALGGGFVGVLVIGVQRAAFSNEAGVGSASIAHSAAKTEEPIREGSVALLGPFIDTIVVCSMTALVILITGAWNNETWVVEQGLEGTPVTSRAFEQELSWFPYVLSVAVVLFAYSTMISWSYYGERCWERLFGPRSIMVYKIIFVMAVFCGAIFHLGAVLVFSDLMILSMAFPNIFGLLLLSPKVRRDLKDYWKRYKEGQFKTFK
ncbi:MAG: alanine:cation symporter family protein [Planctomycetes bacterium]|nr:alanine:cation symporter family protein [Planctomycetota bacterium]